VRASARPAADAEAIEAELVGERAYVGDLVDHTTAVMAIRPPIPGAIVRHEAHAELDVQFLTRPPPKTTARRAMQGKDREPFWITPDRERKRTTIGRPKRSQRLAHPASISGQARGSKSTPCHAPVFGMSPERQGTGLYLIASPNELEQTTRLRCTEQAKSKNLDQPLA
jgi:hypothetical protein